MVENDCVSFDTWFQLYVNTNFYVWVSVHHTLIYIKKTNLMQSSSMFIGNCKTAVHVSVAFCVHLQEHYEL